MPALHINTVKQRFLERKHQYPDRILLKMPLWQQILMLAFPLFLLYVIFASDSLPDTNWISLFIGSIMCITLFTVIIIRFYLDRSMLLTPDGIIFTDYGRLRAYQWHKVKKFHSTCINYYPNISSYYFYLTDGKRVNIPYNYGFRMTKLNKILNAYHEAVLEKQGIDYRAWSSA